jgi:fatty-acyl-CoA synthase
MHAADLLSKRAEPDPGSRSAAGITHGTRYTYADLNARANHLANFLQTELGVQKGDRVSILAHNSVVYGPAVRAGQDRRDPGPVELAAGGPELVYIVNDCSPKVLIVGPEFTDVLAKMRPRIDVAHYVSLEGAAVDGAWVYEEASGWRPMRNRRVPRWTAKPPPRSCIPPARPGSPKAR